MLIDVISRGTQADGINANPMENTDALSVFLYSPVDTFLNCKSEILYSDLLNVKT